MQEFLEEEREMIFEAMKLAPSRRTVASFLNIPVTGEYLLLLLESLLYFSLPSDFTDCTEYVAGRLLLQIHFQVGRHSYLPTKRK